MNCSLADASLCKVVSSIALLQGNMVVYKRSHKEVHNPYYSNFTSGNNSKGARTYAHSCGKGLVMVTIKQKKTWQEYKYEQKYYLLNHMNSFGCSSLQPLKAEITRGR